MEAQNTAFNFQYYCHTEGEKKMQSLSFICLPVQKMWLETVENEHYKKTTTVIHKNPA